MLLTFTSIWLSFVVEILCISIFVAVSIYAACARRAYKLSEEETESPGTGMTLSVSFSAKLSVNQCNAISALSLWPLDGQRGLSICAS